MGIICIRSVSYTHLIDSLAAKAMRVLAFGYSEKELVKNQINDDLVIIGLCLLYTSLHHLCLQRKVYQQMKKTQKM